ncbi:MAG: aldo/keto reductase [Clostridia bacterium]|nr:aldo/keto reductase [Clostridia bacterium]
MKKNKLGSTDLTVSKICFGTLTIGPLQSNMTIEEGSFIIERALSEGINFLDTAELYGTYPYIRTAIRKTGIRPVIATKSYAYSKEQAIKSLEQAMTQLDTDVIDIFMLHEQESEWTMKGHREALDYYLNEKEKGRIRAVGVSTHAVNVVNYAAAMKEIDVISPIYNLKGLGIIDGTGKEMKEAISNAKSMGKGIYTMKPLGGGNIINDYDACLDFLINDEDIDSIAIGMRSIEELEMNIRKISQQEIPQKLREKVSLQKRSLHIEFWCEKCRKCIAKCQQNALSFNHDQIEVNHDKCVMCGYCSAVCDVFAIKIY